MTLKRKAISSAILGIAAVFVVFLAPFLLLAVVGILLGATGIVRGIRALLECRRLPDRTIALRYAKVAWISIVSIAAFVPLAIWEVDGLHVDNPAGFSSPKVVADYTGIMPPAAARNIRTAAWCEGMGFDDFVRFEAPSADCLAYAKQLAKGRPLIHFDSPISDPTKIARQWIPNLSWFDLPQARDVIGTEWEPSVWVDQSRGVFYFHVGF